MQMLYRILLVLLPLPTLAQDTSDAGSSLTLALRAGIGFFGAISIIVFIVGLGTYLTRLGTERREEGITTMEQSLTILIIVVIVTGILRWIES